jgi:ribosomal protein S4E
MKVLILKGEHKGKTATITNTQKEYIGQGKIYALKTNNGKIWNGSFTYFPQSFIEEI